MLSDNQLSHLKQLIDTKQITKTAAAKHFNMDRKRLGDFMDNQGYGANKLTAGRPKKEISNQTKQLIIDANSQYPQGITKTYYKLIADCEEKHKHTSNSNESEVPQNLQYIPESMVLPPSYTDIRKVFKSENLLKYEKQNLPEIGKTRYEAVYSDLIWHVDIHFLQHKKSQPFYAIIDDYSRYIVGFGELSDCCAATCLSLVIDAISNHGKPFAIWSDNGSETKEVFHTYLVNNKIIHICTRPRSPQQNGKIERFWQTFESNYPNLDIKDIIELYNSTPHMSLPKKKVSINGIQYSRPASPKELFFDENKKWNPSIEPQWRVDGILHPFYQDEWVNNYNIIY